ncbi:MAG: hypothetical protein JWO24_4164 [Rhodospirillales bacterium]|nr:hypothetical protein [Rhodospirillales bacterium]
MDRAQAAAMSDPDRNQHFRRRWCEVPAARIIVGIGSTMMPSLGTLGYALLEALARARAKDDGTLNATRRPGVPR